MRLLLGAFLPLLGTGFLSSRPLSAAPLPERQIPQTEEKLPEPGPEEGLLLLDTTDGPTRVEIHEKEIRGRATEGTGDVKVTMVQGGYRLLCETPCAVALPQGAHDIQLRGTETSWKQIVEISKRPTVVRVTPTRITEDHRPRLLFSVMYTAGLIGAVLGGSLYLAAQDPSSPQAEEEAPQQRRNAMFLGLGGVGLLGLTFALDYTLAPTIRPGSSISFKLNPATTPSP